MPFGALGANERVRILLELKGAAEYVAGMRATSEATLQNRTAVRKQEVAMAALNKKTFLQNQLMFTSRRLLFYTTLGFVALGAEVIKLGFSYNNALQTSRVALQDVIKPTKALDDELGKLYRIAALSPFLFKDTVVAFRNMYAAFKPLGFSIEFTNKTIQGLIDALAYGGRTTPAALNRVSIALQHMGFVGRPLARTIQQLSSDGLPVWAALHVEMGLTDEQLHNIANSGVTAKQVIQALNKYIAETPGFAGQAMKQANETLSGGWAQFIDILSQASGSATSGLFGGLTKMFQKINENLAPLVKANKPIGLYDLVNAIDNALTPKTHAIISLYQIFVGILRTFSDTLIVVAGSFKIISYALGILTGQTGANQWAFRQLGRVLGVLLIVWAIMKARLTAVALKTELLILRDFALGAAQKALAIAIWITNFALNAQFREFKLLILYAWLTAASMRAVAIATKLLNIAMTNLTTIAILALIVGLVVLYQRSKTFRNMINGLWRDLIYFSPIVAVALTQAFGPIGAAVTGLLLIIRYWKQIKNLSKTSNNTPILGITPSSPDNKHHSFLGKLFRGDYLYPHFAAGGVQSRAGWALVGERGPELVNLPGGSVIHPNKDLMGGINLNITVKPQDIYISGKKIATVHAEAITDKQARL